MVGLALLRERLSQVVSAALPRMRHSVCVVSMSVQRTSCVQLVSIRIPPALHIRCTLLCARYRLQDIHRLYRNWLRLRSLFAARGSMWHTTYVMSRRCITHDTMRKRTCCTWYRHCFHVGHHGGSGVVTGEGVESRRCGVSRPNRSAGKRASENRTRSW